MTPSSIQLAKKADPAADPLAILECLEVGVLLCDQEGRIRYRNRQAARMLGETPDLGSAFHRLRFRSDSHWRTHLARVFSSHTPVCWQGAILDAPFGLLTIHACSFPGRADIAVVSLTTSPGHFHPESTEVAQRLAALGKLAARVAHELNNPLDGILRYINLALRLSGDPGLSKLTEYLHESRFGLMRMIGIIGDLLEFSRGSDASFDESTVGEVIDQAIKANTHAADTSRVVVTADFQGVQGPRIRAGRLYQVCCNLIRNAIDAMPDGGRLSVSTAVGDQGVVVRIADTGSGLPDPSEKVFEPFYSTKPPGKGTGLGLAICKEFVENMGGNIHAETASAGGAVFTVRIPIHGLLPPQKITPAHDLARNETHAPQG